MRVCWFVGFEFGIERSMNSNRFPSSLENKTKTVPVDFCRTERVQVALESLLFIRHRSYTRVNVRTAGTHPVVFVVVAVVVVVVVVSFEAVVGTKPQGGCSAISAQRNPVDKYPCYYCCSGRAKFLRRFAIRSGAKFRVTINAFVKANHSSPSTSVAKKSKKKNVEINAETDDNFLFSLKSLKTPRGDWKSQTGVDVQNQTFRYTVPNFKENTNSNVNKTRFVNVM